MRPSSSPGHSTDAPFTTTAAAASAATATATAREPSPVNQQPPVKARTTEAVVEGRLPSPRKRRPSHHPDPDPDDASAAQDQQLSTAPDDQRSKKRRTGPGARGVANLTPEQLAKKRANGMPPSPLPPGLTHHHHRHPPCIAVYLCTCSHHRR
ncbi:hypothetical protein F4778DRAFT_460765 [Xylariomycetidae sp. FL2044]|nr:hypothetical protein F4778DRAFT_460765 [Xylariomycetidae sp. FL2044]